MPHEQFWIYEILWLSDIWLCFHRSKVIKRDWWTRDMCSRSLIRIFGYKIFNIQYRIQNLAIVEVNDLVLDVGAGKRSFQSWQTWWLPMLSLVRQIQIRNHSKWQSTNLIYIMKILLLIWFVVSLLVYIQLLNRINALCWYLIYLILPLTMVSGLHWLAWFVTKYTFKCFHGSVKIKHL